MYIVDNYKLLGFYLDKKLSFNININNFKVSKIIYFIKKLLFLNNTNLILLYNSFFI